MNEQVNELQCYDSNTSDGSRQTEKSVLHVRSRNGFEADHSQVTEPHPLSPSHMDIRMKYKKDVVSSPKLCQDRRKF